MMSSLTSSRFRDWNIATAGSRCARPLSAWQRPMKASHEGVCPGGWVEHKFDKWKSYLEKNIIFLFMRMFGLISISKDSDKFSLFKLWSVQISVIVGRDGLFRRSPWSPECYSFEVVDSFAQSSRNLIEPYKPKNLNWSRKTGFGTL